MEKRQFLPNHPSEYPRFHHSPLLSALSNRYAGPMANATFLWHMHQPYYADPTTRTATMPWVRVHSVKGYLDMIAVLEDFPRVRVNFNFTPVLVLQIQQLITAKIRDAWLDLSRKPAAELDEREKFSRLENFFKIHWENLV